MHVVDAKEFWLEWPRQDHNYLSVVCLILRYGHPYELLDNLNPVMLLSLISPALHVCYIIAGDCDLEIANALRIEKVRPNLSIFESRVLMLGLA